MGCTPITDGKKVYGFICNPTIKEFGRKYLFCIDCKRKRYFWTTFQEWYGWDGTCLTCGAEFGGDEWLPKPFMPKWREINIKSAKRSMERLLALRKEEKK